MRTRRTLTPNKKLLLSAIIANPGISTSQLVKLSGRPLGLVQRLLTELAGTWKLIYSETGKSNRHRVIKWYVGNVLDYCSETEVLDKISEPQH